MLFGLAYLLFLSHRASGDRIAFYGGLRLYWEYAGRLTHRAVTEGYLELVDHRVGSLKAPETAASLDEILPPYSGFSSPYPPGALLVFSAVRLPFDDLHRFSFAFGVLDSIALCVAALLTIRLAQRKFGDPRAPIIIASTFAVWIVLTGTFVVSRFDPIVVLLTTIALLAWEAERRWNAGLWLGLGASMKLWPMLLVPVLVLARREGPRTAVFTRRTLLVGSGAMVGFALPHLVVLAMGTAPSDLFNYLTVYAARPPQVESLQANLLAVGQILGVTIVTLDSDFGSHNFVTNNWQALSRFFSLAFLAAYLGTLIVVMTAPSPRKVEVFGMGFIIIALILCSKVFSGEYLIWMMPFALLAAGSRHWGIVASYAIALIFLRLVYWNWNSVTSVELLGTSILTAKNAACVAMAWIFAREISNSAGYRAASHVD
jgi:hypothetical protein